VILLWGLELDSPIVRVRDWLRIWEADHVFVNHADVLEMDVHLTTEPSVSGVLRVGARELPLEALGSMYVRPYDFREFPHMRTLPPRGVQWRHAHAFDDVLWTFADLTPGLVLNRPTSMLSNTAKPLQWEAIRQAGFSVPRTLITTSVEAVCQFAREHGPLVYKSVSGHRSIVRQLDPNDRDRLETDLRWCPTQFQEYVSGIDYRVHVVGPTVFATRMDSESTDYRYEPAVYSPAQVPVSVARACVELAGQLGLTLAGIDLKVTDQFEWYCFEANPSPAYSCYEDETGQGISEAIARLLVESDLARRDRSPAPAPGAQCAPSGASYLVQRAGRESNPQPSDP
jgi:glutathione synthase/RimK-type ligase-like ATP-grasp enzyme